jgi:signal peptidase I
MLQRLRISCAVAFAAMMGMSLPVTPAHAAFFSALYSIPSASMEPTLRQGEYILADTTYYQSYSPHRGDLVIYAYPKDPSVRYLKRIVAIAGDRVAVQNGQAIVNGTPVDEPYATFGDPGAFYNTTREVVVPEGHVFVLGDNRPNSTDSRVAAHGTVPVGNLIGRASYVAFSRDVRRIGTWVGTPGGK